MVKETKIAVVVPCYKVKNHILDVISKIGDEVSKVYIVDDFCPDASGDFVKFNCQDERIVVIRHMQNKGVGGAVMTGYQAAIDYGAQLIVKIDGDGQMDPSLIPFFVAPILSGHADYTKGNRFFDLDQIKTMPTIRIFGNAVLSFMTKISSGYWDLFDPTNGYTAIHANVARRLPIDKISNRYFFETDMLFRLNTLRAVVVDIPMDSKYGNEISNLKIRKILGEFLYKHSKNCCKRIFYNYYLRNVSLASIELPIGILLFIFGVVYGAIHWHESIIYGVPATAGVVMISALPILVGFQLMLAFLGYDISTVPRLPIHANLASKPYLKINDI